MPIEYTASGGGVLKEHTAVRESVGLFDVSHLGKATVRGPGARDFVNVCLTNDLGRIEPGQAQYTLCCDPSGGVVDDLIAYLVADDEVFLVPERGEYGRGGAPARRGGTGLASRSPGQHRAVRGARRAGAAFGRCPRPARPALRSATTWLMPTRRSRALRCAICRTGYTGEHGYELIPAWDDAPALWDALVDVVREFGGMPAGLGARDTLRTEMGYPLHGQDLSLSISPVQARLGLGGRLEEGRVLGTRRAGRREGGRAGAHAAGSGGARPRHPASAHDRARRRRVAGRRGDQRDVLARTLKKGIGLALVDTASGVSEGDEVAVDVRGRRCAMRVVRPPFVESHVR